MPGTASSNARHKKKLDDLFDLGSSQLARNLKIRMELQAPVVEADPARSRGGGDEDTLQAALLPCPNCDIQVVHKLAQLLLPGLAAACVDSTFRNPSSSPAVQLRAELVRYITDRSNGPPELPTDDDPLPDHDDPGEALATFLEDFASSKRSIVVAISGWLPYLGGDDGRDDRIDDLVQEMEATRFWPIDRREAVARDLLRGLDADCRFRCRDELDTEEGTCSRRRTACGAGAAPRGSVWAWA